ncbi:hypothetical protein HUO13_03175 [Saccharopolyspora erythraea]|uniref:hypothetical protein n=1 Tax=Saccharopolyspora erythraea TaxID=1836 RepID=UPI001BA74DC0|nr:hypothetical protein [Saccharopolyspora erythraea]QUG99940.1 hypothetical protein HUO13_03175 [Saccharopolyspora erythraea]
MASSSSRSAVMPVAMGMFGLGLIAVVAVFALYAAGSTDLPLWLNLATLLAPAGLVTGVVAIVVRSRRASRGTR